ncbi:MAG: NAD(P)H-hydrate dehydratase [Acetobacteraceae bacterium]
MARADALAPTLGVPAAALMEAAGRAVARAVRARIRPCRTLVLCGPGNNGGDGRVAARLLAHEGWPVETAAIGSFAPATAARADLVIDAVFGAGLSRDVAGLTADTLRAARRIVAIDVPSGLDGATGAVRGFAARAELTVTFFRLKPGHLLLPGRELCGEIVLAAIGMPPDVLAAIVPRTMVNVPGFWRLPRPTPEGHKYTRGHVGVLGGPEMTGAARLAAEAARRIGAGMVTIAAPWGGADVYRTGAPGTIVSSASLAELLADARRAVWVCGPGLGPDAAREALPVLLAAKRSVVADADTFTAFAGQPDALIGAAILTPHAAEFARVFGPPGEDRLAAVRAAAARTGAAVVLKGADTIIAAPDGRVAINANAPPWLATAGSGDVLAGTIGGLLAQGMAPWEAACAGVFAHGRAGARAGPGLIAEDLLLALRAGESLPFARIGRSLG